MLAFVQGAAWWEYHRTKGTMWQSDRKLAEEEAARREQSGTLGEDEKKEKREKLEELLEDAKYEFNEASEEMERAKIKIKEIEEKIRKLDEVAK
jgi:ElaB/YqjD/DUF883 family membrane-anchored ribosome-binding protein